MLSNTGNILYLLASVVCLFICHWWGQYVEFLKKMNFKGGMLLRMRARSLICPSIWKAGLLLNIARCKLFNETWFLLENMFSIWFFQILDKCLNHWTIASSSCYAFRKVLAITLNAMTPKENKSSVPWGLKHVFWYFRYPAWDIWPHTENNELKSEDEMDCGMIVFVVVLFWCCCFVLFFK